MRGGYYGHWFGFGMGAWVVPIIIIAALLILAAAVVWYVQGRRARARAAGLSESQRETLGDFETQVTALIAQRGGEVDQTMIVAALSLPAQLVAEKLLELERGGAIERHWSVDRMTYSIKRSVA
jgi:hypothetical protein